MSSVFYVFERVPTTHEQLGRKVGRRAGDLRRHRGQVVAVWADNGPDFVINLFALWEAGAIPFLVSRRLRWGTAAPRRWHACAGSSWAGRCSARSSAIVSTPPASA